MFLSVDADDHTPIYRQVADGIKSLIARGDLREGMVLPSVRQVAGDLGVNLNTVAVAYRQLRDEGLVTVRHGAGAVVAPRRDREMEQSDMRKPLRSALTQMILAGMNDREILVAAREELALLHKKGGSR